MAGYISVSLPDDPDDLTDEILQSLVANQPGFVAKEGHLEVSLLEVVARVISETRYLFNKVPESIFRYFGDSILNLPPVPGAAATAFTDWTMIDNAGYTIPVGTQVAYRIAGDKLRIFETTEEHEVSPGDTQALNVLIRSIEEGEADNDLGTSGLELIDSLAYVSALAAVAATSGGVDPETDDDYLSRLSDEMKLLSPRFVLAQDAAVLARRVAGVHRALGVDNYDPVGETYGNEKMITVVVVGEDGLALSSGVKTDVEDYLESLRELNFVVHVVDPSYTEIDVDFQVRVLSGFLTSDVTTRVTAALTEYLSPEVWAGGQEDPPVWRTNSDVVRYLEVAEVINRVDGVDYIETLTVNTLTADVDMVDVGSLPTVGTITGAATDA